ncbi:hypothetical protein [Jiella avicenniae]|uniref:Uncharacterized protein n=1 Tax=Jiella avicenniae TaxID=2907202 RepID=A0A9X1NXH6_9HYPH|nr:hypothetical protein [Jiella avicenniae]MCE7026585.1 hypothetical protein [Jiella avicenniae]
MPNGHHPPTALSSTIEPVDRRGSGAELPDRSAEDSLSALLALVYGVPRVLCLRIPRLVDEIAIYSPFERTETRLAITEKSGAFLEGLAAAQAATVVACLTLQAETLSGRWMPWRVIDVVDAIVAAGLAPSVLRLEANDTRLSSDG